jgi:hypothetical protein
VYCFGDGDGGLTPLAGAVEKNAFRDEAEDELLGVVGVEGSGDGAFG